MYEAKKPITSMDAIKAKLDPLHPSQVNKIIDHVDVHCRAWIERTTFVSTRIGASGQRFKRRCVPGSSPFALGSKQTRRNAKSFPPRSRFTTFSRPFRHLFVEVILSPRPPRRRRTIAIPP